jgi:hypothetical protein
MPLPVVINGDISAEGSEQIPSLTIAPSGILRSKYGLQLFVEGDLLILGSVRGEPGAPLSLTSTKGNIFVLGQVLTSRGRDATEPGKAGEHAGALTLAAPMGEIIVTGSIEGGAGGDAIAVTNFPLPSDTRSGPGGSGGDIVLQAKLVSLRGGTLRAGNGGHGGTALADGWTGTAAIAWFLANVLPPGGPMNLPPAQPPEPPLLVPDGEIAEKIVGALSGNGGRGGDVRLVSIVGGSLGWMNAGGTITAGVGGNARWAHALRGVDAAATVGSPGPGGRIVYQMASDGTLGVWQRNSAETPGEGGDAAEAIAAGAKTASAATGPGGPGGRVVVDGAVPTNVTANGGDVATARAVTTTTDRTVGPSPGGAGGPGALVTAQAP